ALDRAKAQENLPGDSALADLKKRAEAASRKAADMKLLAERSLGRVAAAKLSQARWKSALQAQGTPAKVAAK
ncbi:MAG: hypothetical protein ACREDG_06065, partial [Methylocella sp.]